MAKKWGDSRRRSELPKDWESVRALVRRRAGGQCEEMSQVTGEPPLRAYAQGTRCWRQGTDCDHVGNPYDHSPSNLQWLCAQHHQLKTAEASAASRRRLGTVKRAPEPHPRLQMRKDARRW